MLKFDPRSIQTLATGLNTVANVVIALAVMVGIVFFGVGISLANDIGGFGIVAGLVWFGAIVGAGYVQALLLRAAAQLMLAVVTIEDNTRVAGQSERMNVGPSESPQSHPQQNPQPVRPGGMACPMCAGVYWGTFEQCPKCKVALSPAD